MNFKKLSQADIQFFGMLISKATDGIEASEAEFVKLKTRFIKCASKRELKKAWAMQYDDIKGFAEAYANCEICPVEEEEDGVVLDFPISRPAPPAFRIGRKLPTIVCFTEISLVKL
jgi:hypothetical protein